LVSIASAAAFDIFQNSPVALDTNGNLVLPAPGARAIGSFQGVEFVDTEGRYRVSNRWVANTVATDIRAYYTQTQDNLVYEIQANATLTAAAIGDQFDWTAIAGNGVTGLSSVALDVASAAGPGANAGLRVLGLNPGPDNEWSDPFPIVLVQVSEHQFVADRVAI
jgi:hypothetical protein